MSSPPIKQFSGEYRFLSNFYPSVIFSEGITYATVEHAFQASKSIDHSERFRISQLDTPGQAKRAGRNLQLRSDWEEVKSIVMLQLIRKKFEITLLRSKLIATGERLLVEGNTWGDTYWGVCDGKGQNQLGAILMRVRKEIVDGG